MSSSISLSIVEATKLKLKNIVHNSPNFELPTSLPFLFQELITKSLNPPQQNAKKARTCTIKYSQKSCGSKFNFL